MQASPNAEPAAPAQPAPGRVVIRNTIILTASQVVTVPLAVLVNAILARYLGAADFGFMYLAGTLSGFGYLAVTWGHEGALPALVARAHGDAGALLGSSLAWRAITSIPVFLVLGVISHFLHYTTEFLWVLGLTCLTSTLNAFVSSCKDAVRGFERMEVPAYAHVGQQFLWTITVVVVLLVGGRLRATLLGQAFTYAAVLVLVWRTLRPTGIAPIRVTRAASKSLLIAGVPFVVLSLAMSLQGNIDAVFLSKLAPPEAMGWFAVARRLIGVLVLPASTLIGALYPTLCRLRGTDDKAFVSTSRGALQGVALLVFPVALGCGLYPDLGIAIFSRKSFGPAEDDLRVLAAFLFLMYFSMPLGSCILAAGKERAWSVVQSICVVVSLVLDPFLVPFFQRRMGNGSLGPCVAAAISETLVVICALFLAPRGVFDRRLARTLLLASVAGAAMALVAYLTRSIPSVIGAGAAVVTYAVVLYLTGGIEPERVQAVRALLDRKLRRR